MKSPYTLRWAAGVSGSVLMVFAAAKGLRYHQDLQASQQRIAGGGSQVIHTACG